MKILKTNNVANQDLPSASELVTFQEQKEAEEKEKFKKYFGDKFEWGINVKGMIKGSELFEGPVKPDGKQWDIQTIYIQSGDQTFELKEFRDRSDSNRKPFTVVKIHYPVFVSVRSYDDKKNIITGDLSYMAS